MYPHCLARKGETETYNEKEFVMERSESIELLAEALVGAQAEMPKVVFDSEAYRYRYASLGAVIDVVKPILSKWGLAVSMPVFSEGNAIGIEAVLMHKSGQYISTKASLRVEESEDMKRPAAQFAGSNITYLRRYALSSLLGLYSDEDNDAGDGKVISKPEVKNKPSTLNAVPDGRPFSLEKLIEKLGVTADSVKPITAPQQRLLVSLLRDHTGGDDDRRHAIQSYLFGVESLTEADPKMANAVLRWLDPQPDPDGTGNKILPAVVKAELKILETVINLTV